jgi:Domain of unknown function (DUF4388)
MLEQPAPAPEAAPVTPTSATPAGDTAVDPFSPTAYGPDATVVGAAPGIRGGEHDDPPAASLVGSLSVFNLADVLLLLSTTDQTGELQVVSETVDGKVWLARGALSNARVGTATTIGRAVFELACLTEGWFYFTAGVVSTSGQPTVPVVAVLDEVRPQVDEWRAITSVIALGAAVGLAPDAPGHDVQIRSDQWRVLTTVGANPNSVREVLDHIGGDPIVTLRTLRDLHQYGLIVVGSMPTHRVSTVTAPPIPEVSSPAPPNPTAAEWDPPGGPATTPVMTTGGGHATDITALPAPPEGDPEVSYPPVIEQVPPTTPAAVVVGQGDNRSDSLAGVAFMPPPVTSDPWAPPADSGGSSQNGVA